MGYLSRPINIVVVAAATVQIGTVVAFALGKHIPRPDLMTASGWLLGSGFIIASLLLLGALAISVWDRFSRNLQLEKE